MESSSDNNKKNRLKIHNNTVELIDILERDYNIDLSREARLDIFVCFLIYVHRHGLIDRETNEFEASYPIVSIAKNSLSDLLEHILFVKKDKFNYQRFEVELNHCIESTGKFFMNEYCLKRIDNPNMDDRDILFQNIIFFLNQKGYKKFGISTLTISSELRMNGDELLPLHYDDFVSYTCNVPKS